MKLSYVLSLILSTMLVTNSHAGTRNCAYGNARSKDGIVDSHRSWAQAENNGNKRVATGQGLAKTTDNTGKQK